MARQDYVYRMTGLAGAVALALAAVASPASADERDPPKLLTLLGIGSAAVAPNRAAFATLSYSDRSDLGDSFVDSDDASASIGTVVGDAGTGIGLQFGASFTGLASDPTGSGFGFGGSGYLSVKAAHLMQGGKVPVFLAVSADHLAGWGLAKDIDPALSAIVTAFPTARFGDHSFPLMLTLGLGDHIRNAGTDPGGFVGIGMGLSPNFGASVAWTGETVTIGGTYRNDSLRNISFSAQLDDAFDQEDGRRVTISATILLENAFGG
jgi:hypothetical protein